MQKTTIILCLTLVAVALIPPSNAAAIITHYTPSPAVEGTLGGPVTPACVTTLNLGTPTGPTDVVRQIDDYYYRGIAEWAGASWVFEGFCM